MSWLCQKSINVFLSEEYLDKVSRYMNADKLLEENFEITQQQITVHCDCDHGDWQFCECDLEPLDQMEALDLTDIVRIWTNGGILSPKSLENLHDWIWYRINDPDNDPTDPEYELDWDNANRKILIDCDSFGVPQYQNFSVSVRGYLFHIHELEVIRPHIVDFLVHRKPVIVYYQ
ncbi:hypothetical protein [Acanthamoeba castellanii mimivirus]|uniref:Uncharacterized protein L39 n=5 Tax=Mimivirus TaxID=315393 RepID=YL039_MIMIV|nr:hypothetical protein MIMI_gp0047 [Acanthamoeba polyphaga mimivirus]Q5UPB1.1 RecName: Full=Uncharacterized protein L39 [Acanthamoeba polyphaga mimivirus]AEQ60205.1 hypothetical protein [Acanthamoeba castellanii mamavirus]AHJ39861.1 hypothetical protein [Samba virus]AMZ02490.1 hypothetical protein [Mimivirus Bombay]EJN41245.1 hypothetical protein lvs_L16 [Acanthamoeba polyphaga lentillevirus]BAV61116.1 hypothetical protein [Acanthamoeba castellanii mimivirus]